MVILLVLFSNFRSAVFDAWRSKVAADLCARKGFRGGPLLDIPGSHQLLDSSHVREGGVWNGFLLGKVGGEVVPCRFCGQGDGDGHLFWECTFLSLQHVRDLPEFAYLVSLDRSKWPRCLIWHGWLPGLNGIGNKSLGYLLW